MLNIASINNQLSKVNIRIKNGRLYIRGTFPEGRKEIGTGCKATPEGLKIALGKAKEIDSQLLLEKWIPKEKSKDLLVGEAIDIFTKAYWRKYKKDKNKEYNYHHNKLRIFLELPQDEKLTERLIIKYLDSFPSCSSAQTVAITQLKTLTKHFNIEVNYSQFGKATPEKKTLPLYEEIVKIYNNVTPHRQWILGILYTFGLRPHELYRCEYLFDRNPKVIKVDENSKTGYRMVYPLASPEINIFDLEIRGLVGDRTRPNSLLGKNISTLFVKYPFTAYQLRHYYAVRGAMEGISPVVMSKWMGHSLQEHYRSYASLLGEIESDKLWINKFQDN